MILRFCDFLIFIILDILSALVTTFIYLQMMSLYLREMTRSTSMLVRPISTTSRLDLGSRTYDATTILEDEKKGLSR